MKKVLSVVLVFLIANTCFSQFVVPTRVGKYVHDYENVLTSTQVADLKSQITKMFDSSSMEIAVVILNDLQGYSIEEAALAIGRQWGVGQKDINNGIVYLISPVNRKARLEIGYGLEGDIPDVTAQEIGDAATQYYKQKDYYSGIKYVITELNHRLDPTYKEQLAKKAALVKEENEKTLKNIFMWTVYLMLFGLVVFLIVFTIKCRIRYKSLSAKLNDLLNNLHKIYSDISSKFDYDFLKYETSGQYDEFQIYMKNVSSLIIKLREQSIYKSISDISDAYDKLVYDLRLNDIYKGEESLKDEIKEYNNAIQENPSLVNEIKGLFDKYKDVLDNTEKKQSFVDSLNKAYKTKSLTKLNQLLKTLKDSIIKHLTLNVPACDLYQERIKTLKQTFEPKIEDKKNEIKKLYDKYSNELTPIILLNLLLTISDNEDYQKRYNEICGSYDKLVGILRNQVPSSDEYKARVAEEQRKKKEEEEEERRRKKRQEEDEERRRNDSYYSSSYSSYDSGSSSYGGGSFGGGGASSSW